jgi:hypothetical protein
VKSGPNFFGGLDFIIFLLLFWERGASDIFGAAGVEK